MTKTELQEMISAEQDGPKKQRLLDLLDKMISFEQEERPLVNELNNIGLKVESVWDLVNNRPHPYLKNNFTGDYEVAYPILVKHLDFDYHPRIKEGIVRALTEKKAAKLAADRILELFHKEPDKNLKWVMANALRTMLTWRQREKHPEIKQILKGAE
jgi:hypothetical protein